MELPQPPQGRTSAVNALPQRTSAAPGVHALPQRTSGVKGTTRKKKGDEGFITAYEDDDDKCFRQMYDKNTLRIDKGGTLFKKAIEKYRNDGPPSEEMESPANIKDLIAQYKNNLVRVFCRKRPIFDKDL